MGAKSQGTGRHTVLSVLLYALTGLALLLVFLPIWDEISEYRVLLLVLLVAVLIILQGLDWRRQRVERKERRRRWGLARDRRGDESP